jgi:hypothetical protein
MLDHRQGLSKVLVPPKRGQSKRKQSLSQQNRAIMVDKTHLTTAEGGAGEEPSDIRASDDGFLIASSMYFSYSNDGKKNFPFFVDGASRRPCCTGYHAPRKPGRIADRIPDNLWEDFCAAVIAIILRMNRTFAAVIYMLIMLPLVLQNLPVSQDGLVGLFIAACTMLANVILIAFFFMWDGRWYLDSFRAVVDEYRAKFAQRGVMIRLVEEARSASCCLGQRYATFLIFRLLDQEQEQPKLSSGAENGGTLV